MSTSTSYRAPGFVQLLRSSLMLACLGLSANAHALAGCPWQPVSTDSDKGIVDSNAGYWSSLMPNDIKAGTTVQIYNRYPQLRFFDFTIYHNGDMIDYLDDAVLYPLEGGSPNPNVAAVPFSNDYTDHYKITIKYEDAPQPPLTRDPNTLYAGSDLSRARLLIMRGYLPNDGSDATGNTGLPELTQINPDGSSQRYDTKSTNLGCPVVGLLSSILYHLKLPDLAAASKDPSFQILDTTDYNNGGGLFPSYSNFDAGYGYLMSKPKFGDLLLIREKLPATPSSNVAAADLQVRYLSICGYIPNLHKVLACLPDSELTTQSDGYFNIVVSTDKNRPPLANPADGYDWISWQNNTDRALFIIRELLPNASFPGNFFTAAQTSDPLGKLGVWAPQATYCDSQTFNDHAASGGAAVFSACQAANH